jgi:hypothetical protein
MRTYIVFYVPLYKSCSIVIKLVLNLLMTYEILLCLGESPRNRNNQQPFKSLRDGSYLLVQ